MLEIIGYIASVVIGISLGLIGGGGSILTLPVLVYCFGILPGLATVDSLFIVGVTSLVGSVRNYRLKRINFPAAIYFGISSILTVILTRFYIVPFIPELLFYFGEYKVTKSVVTMLLFAALVLFAAIRMLSEHDPTNNNQHRKISFVKALLNGIALGVLTGLLGAGGGFLIIPVLVFAFKLEMKEAIGTSLFIIALNTLSGFTAEVLNSHPIIWNQLLLITLLSIVGVLIGQFLNNRINGNVLKRRFGWFILAMGIFIVIKELVL
jgi:uncharacterized membrane protein YfcA